jgi:putative ABC transport system permease protein
MLKNYIKIALRNLLKNKVYSGINIAGLALGVGACLIILNFVLFEFSYDRFHSKASAIYRITSQSKNELQNGTPLSPMPLGPEIKRNYKEVLHATRMILPWSGQAASSTLGRLDQGKTEVKKNFDWGFYTNPDFFELFDFPMLVGNAGQALAKPNSIVLAESAAVKLFGDNWRQSYVLGQSVEYVNEFDRFYLEITGVISDAPENSHFRYDFLASFSTLSTGWAKDFIETWEGNQVYTYLEFSPVSDPRLVENQIQKYVSENAPEEIRSQLQFGLQPLLDIHLKSNLENELKVNGDLSRVYFLIGLALLILLVAIANYINLSIAKSIARGAEVGIRKIMGARRPQLIQQFLAESFILVLLSLLLAIVIIFLSRPFYFQLTGYHLNLSAPTLWIIIIASAPVLAFFAGIYPACVLSVFDPIRLVKGSSAKIAGSFDLRKVLVVAQFTIAIILVAFTTTMFLQVDHMRTSDPGFSKNGILVLKGPTNRTETWTEHDQKPKTETDESDVFKDEVMQLAGVEEATLSWSVPGGAKLMSGIRLAEKHQNAAVNVMVTDNDYASVYGIQVLTGSYSTDNGVVINESALGILGFENPEKAIGMTFRDERDLEYRINGVIQDYHHFGFKNKIEALIFAKNDPSYKLDSYYSLKVNQENLDRTITEIQSAYANVYPSDAFDYFFMDSHFEKQVQNERTFTKVFTLFALMAIAIASLGLFGLALHNVTERSKELGIRKVLGASVAAILTLLSKDFIKLILIAVVISILVSWYAMDKWLQGFAYRTELIWWIFPLAGAGVLSIALLTVFSQSIKVALENPVKALKRE